MTSDVNGFTHAVLTWMSKSGRDKVSVRFANLFDQEIGIPEAALKRLEHFRPWRLWISLLHLKFMHKPTPTPSVAFVDKYIHVQKSPVDNNEAS